MPYNAYFQHIVNETTNGEESRASINCLSGIINNYRVFANRMDHYNLMMFNNERASAACGI